jgi:hypothetical protein
LASGHDLLRLRAYRTGLPAGPPEGLASRVELILTDVVMMIGRQLERRLAYVYLLVYR